MIPIRYKDLLYDGIRLISFFNTLRWSLVLKLWPPQQPVRLDVGCGPRKATGFVNIDINPLQRPDMWLDIRNGLPYPTGTVYCIVWSHILEHFYPDEVRQILSTLSMKFLHKKQRS